MYYSGKHIESWPVDHSNHTATELSGRPWTTPRLKTSLVAHWTTHSPLVCPYTFSLGPWSRHWEERWTPDTRRETSDARWKKQMQWFVPRHRANHPSLPDGNLTVARLRRSQLTRDHCNDSRPSSGRFSTHLFDLDIRLTDKPKQNSNGVRRGVSVVLQIVSAKTRENPRCLLARIWARVFTERVCDADSETAAPLTMIAPAMIAVPPVYPTLSSTWNLISSEHHLQTGRDRHEFLDA